MNLEDLLNSTFNIVTCCTQGIERSRRAKDALIDLGYTARAYRGGTMRLSKSDAREVLEEIAHAGVILFYDAGSMDQRYIDAAIATLTHAGVQHSITNVQEFKLFLYSKDLNPRDYFEDF